ADPDALAREVARGWQRQAHHAALGGRVGGLADLAVERGDARGHDDRPALAALVGLVLAHRRGAQPQDVVGPDQVHPDHGLERLELRWPALAHGALRPADTRAVHGQADLVERLDRPRDRTLHVALLRPL